MTKTKSTKRSLLMSALSLLMCVSMLIGSTFAWFTDSVSSLNNKIVSGNLDVEMYNALQDNLTDDTKVKDAGLFEEITYWEPGVVAYENLTIANEGTLALRYALNINFDNENTLNGYGLSDKLQVAFVPGGLADGLSRDAVVAAANKAGLDPMESFNEEGKLLPEKHDHIKIDKTDIPVKYVTYAIVIYWEPSADDNNWNANNGQTTSDGKALHIDLGVNLFATQLVAENDSFGPDYDTEAQYLIQAGQTETFENETLTGEVQNNGNVTITDAEMINAGPVLRNNGDATVTDTTMKNEGSTNYLSYSSGENSVTVFENVDATSNGGGLDIRDGEAIFKSGSVTTNSTSTSGRHVFYVAGAKLTIENGNFAFNPTNLTRKGFYVCAENGAEVIIKGGNFGKPSSRSSSSAISNYKTGFYADSTSSITIYGGTFKFDPTNWVATGCEAVKSGDTWTVQAMSAEDANTAFENELTADKENIVVNLGADVTYDVAAWANDAMGGASTKSIVINANGHTITFNQTNSDWNNIVTNSGAKLVINDAKITNAGNNNGPWNRHDLNFACEVELNNVVSDKAMAFKAGATLNNVKINDANTSDTYAIWIQPNGQTVTLDGCTIDMLACTDGRGIKIDEQYVDAAQKVTLIVKNTTFKTEEKSAILVKSVAGADITLENVDISGVAADSTNVVWVDEASVAYADLVTVIGGSKILEP